MSTKTQAGTWALAALSFALTAGCGQWDFSGNGGGGGGIDYDGGAPLTTPPLTGDITVIASDTNVSSALALSGTTLYFLDRGAAITDSVQVVDLTSGGVSTLFLASPDPTAALEDLAVDGSNVYVTQVVVTVGTGGYASRLTAIPRNGGPVATLATATEPLFNVAVAGDVYYAGESSLFQLSPNGGKPATVGGAVNTLTSVGNTAYWAQAEISGTPLSNAQIFTASGSASEPSLFATFEDGAYSLIAGNSTSLFWLTTPSSGSYIVQAALEGGTPTLFTPVSGTVLGLAADENNVYVLSTTPGTTTAELDEYSISDGGYTTLASGIQKPSEGTPEHALALDGNNNVYFATVSGVMSVPE